MLGPNVVTPGMDVWVEAKSITVLEMKGRSGSELIRGTVRYAGKRFAVVGIPFGMTDICESFSYDELSLTDEQDDLLAQNTEIFAGMRRPGKREGA